MTPEFVALIPSGYTPRTCPKAGTAGSAVRASRPTVLGRAAQQIKETLPDVLRGTATGT